jgi:hypothetical protein
MASVDYTAHFNQLLTTYRTNMATYKMTGDYSAKIAAYQAKSWITHYLRWAEATASANTNYINKFVSDYSKTNPELASMQSQMRKIKVKGPELENTYRTAKEAAETDPRDFTPYYIKGALIVGIGALLAVLGA